MAITTCIIPAVRRLATVQPQIWRAGARRSFATRPLLMVKKYTRDHEWIDMDEAGKVGTIGITEYAAKALGDVVYVELPHLDLEVNKEDTVGAVESVKSASDILSPVSGIVKETNHALEEKPANINQSPEGDGWIARIEIKDVSELEGLMTKEEYDAFEKE